jgi:SPP1 family predicted phage head-tail adaptor
MQAGKLRHLVTIQLDEGLQNSDTGVITNDWQPFVTVWAEVRPLSAREFIAAAASQSKVTATVKIRYLAGIKPSMRIVDGEHTYQIEGALGDLRSGKEYLTLPCSEVIQG